MTDRIFPKTALSPIPHILLATCLWLCFHWAMGCVSPFLEHGQTWDWSGAHVTLWWGPRQGDFPWAPLEWLLLKHSHHFQRKPRQPMDVHTRGVRAPSWSQLLLSSHVCDPGSPWTSTREASELPAEASSYLAVMCVIILKADLWALSESAPADARLSTNNNFCLTQPKLQLLSKINNCRVLSHCVLEYFAMQG